MRVCVRMVVTWLRSSRVNKINETEARGLAKAGMDDDSVNLSIGDTGTDAPSTPPDLQEANLEEEWGVWSVPDYAPALPMDHDPLGFAGVAENADAEPVEHA